MRQKRYLALAGNFLVAFLALIMVAACASSPTKVDDTPPLSAVDPATFMAYQYQLAKQEPVPQDTRPLGNTRWEVTSINPKPEKAYTSMILYFKLDGNLEETTRYQDGSTRTETSRYHIVGSTMIIRKPGNDINARFKKEGNSLIIDTGEYSMLLKQAG